MKKLNLINDIKYIIEKHDSFSISEIQADCSPSIPTKGNLTHLIESFYDNCVHVFIYNEKQDNYIDSYTLNYEELSLPLLKEIRQLCIVWQNNN